MRVIDFLHWLLIIVVLVMFTGATAASSETELVLPVKFAEVVAGTSRQKRNALRQLRRSWDDTYIAPLIEILTLSTNASHRDRIVRLLENKTGQSYALDTERWFRWLWARNVNLFDGYPEFKSWLYGNIDPRFRGYFQSRYKNTIRLDEVRWGGVHQDGIPPLLNPKMVNADQADYLGEDNIVFAIEINGDYRAYPKRILAWHEMFVDKVGGKDIAGVYCTLCGSMIIYETTVNGTRHELGTSGFLYRSNKLMYDRATQSLWSTLRGKPVIGPLVGRGIELNSGSVLTTTWREWRRRHPQTTVLSLDTGYDRDYSEGEAYRKYFSSDRLMFSVPKLDRRLRNKAEIIGIRSGDEALAISVMFLSKNPLYHEQINGQNVVVVTDESGASRVYQSGDTRFVNWDGNRELNDTNELTWTLSESSLISAQGTLLERFPAHRAFWFGWYSAFGDTRLVK